ncbi:MAG: hypothetical protein C0600_15210 [Ignavibacteria bacterium]|nr:MAG: hypothetical protein C0600_15210 [Ignavibacteria bacterium]
MAKVQKRRKGSRKQQALPEAELPQRTNYMILVAGVVVIIIGFLVMSAGDAVSSLSVTIAPLLLFIGFCVIVPAGIMYRKKNKPAEAKAE